MIVMVRLGGHGQAVGGLCRGCFNRLARIFQIVLMLVYRLGHTGGQGG